LLTALVAERATTMASRTVSTGTKFGGAVPQREGLSDAVAQFGPAAARLVQRAGAQLRVGDERVLALVGVRGHRCHEVAEHGRALVAGLAQPDSRGPFGAGVGLAQLAGDMKAADEHNRDGQQDEGRLPAHHPRADLA
jgi:hypothetical protein